MTEEKQIRKARFRIRLGIIAVFIGICCTATVFEDAVSRLGAILFFFGIFLIIRGIVGYPKKAKDKENK